MVFFFEKSLVNERLFEYNVYNYSINCLIGVYFSMNKKKIILIVVAVILTAVIATGVVLKIKHDREVEALRIYNETYLVMDGVEYLRVSTELDLSGKQIVELEKLTELTALKKLNLRDTGITTEQYEMLCAGLPDCQIIWSVPFQDGYLNDDIQELTLNKLSESDLEMLAYLPQLTSVDANLCQDLDAVAKLMEQYPELSVTYMVSIGETAYPYTQDQLTIANPDVDDLMYKLAFLPALTNVTLEGTLPENAKLISLKEAYPNITFLWNLSIYGVETDTLATFIDLSKIQLSDTTELEAALPCFYNLEKVDMIDCGISNEDMDALNKRHSGTKFVWKVRVSGVNVRTDIKYFYPYKMDIKKVGSLGNLRYCTDVEVLDFGHKGISDVSYVEYMPNLRYLLLLECNITDLSVISNCTSLEYLEACSIPVTDFWPLTNLTNLKNLNISYNPFYYSSKKWGAYGDITPLYQMTWLDRLWMAYARLNEEGRNELRAALPNVEILFVSTSDTNQGWRYAPGYYEMRDILGMWYMIH